MLEWVVVLLTDTENLQGGEGVWNMSSLRHMLHLQGGAHHRQFGYVYLKLQREVVSRDLVISIYVSRS